MVRNEKVADADSNYVRNLLIIPTTPRTQKKLILMLAPVAAPKSGRRRFQRE